MIGLAFWVGLFGATLAATPEEPEAWRASPPGPAERTAWAPPTPTPIELSNGVEVLLVHRTGLPLVTVVAMVDGGRRTDLPAQAGLSSLTTNLLDEGTRQHSAAEFAERATALGASFSVGQNDHIAWVRMDALTGDTLEPSLDLLADMVLTPSFAAFDRVRDRVVDDLAAASAQPRWQANRVMNQTLYGLEHPYGTPATGTVDALRSFAFKDVRKYHKKWWHSGNATFVVVGDLPREAARKALEARFGDWKAGKGRAEAVSAPDVPDGPLIVFREQPGAVQSVVQFATVGPARSDGAYLPARLATTMFGGLFSSPLNMNLRETHGWSYGARSWLTGGLGHGRMVGGTSVQADKTAPAISEIIKEMRASVAGTPDAEGLTLARDNLREGLAGDFETNGATAAQFAALRGLELPIDTWERWTESINDVVVSDIDKAGKKYLNPDTHVFIVVGPRTIEVEGTDGPVSVDVVGELKALGYRFSEVP